MSGVARGPAFSLWGLLMGLLLLTSLALGDSAARVVLLGPSERDATVVRLRRELELLGMDVEVVPDSGSARRALAEVAREHHAAAAVSVESSPPAIVLWIDPARAPGGTVGQEIRVEQDLAGSSEPRLLVLRAVELLRERLLPVPAPPASADAGADTGPSIEVPDAPAPAPAHRAAPASVVATSARGPSAFAGPAVLASPGGVNATPHVWLGARWAPLARVDLELLAFLPTTAASVSAREGSMTLRAGALGAGAGVRLTDPASSLFACVGAGLGALLTAFEGQARAPWVSASGLRWAMLPYAHADAGYWLAPQIALRADVMMGFALPEPVLGIAGRRVAVFGEPAAVLAAAIEVRP